MKSLKEYWQQSDDWLENFSMKYPVGSCLPIGAAMTVGSASTFGIGLALNSLLMGAFSVAASPLLIPGAILAISGLVLGAAGALTAAIGAAFLPFEMTHNKKIEVKTNAADQQVRGTGLSLNILENAQVKISSLTAPFNQSAEPLPKELEHKIDAIIAKVSVVRNSVTVTDAGASGNADTYQFVRMKTETLNR